MVSNTYLDGFIPAGAEHNECIKCGICLQNCPVMEMEQEEAKAEIIANGKLDSPGHGK
jgi:NAD-dependent dihydropyrimidine dehydrogenase PreA subunit